MNDRTGQSGQQQEIFRAARTFTCALLAHLHSLHTLLTHALLTHALLALTLIVRTLLALLARTARTNIASYLAHTFHHCSNTNDITSSHTSRTFVFTDAGTTLYLQMLVVHLFLLILVARWYLRMLLSHCKCWRTCIVVGACMGRYLYLLSLHCGCLYLHCRLLRSAVLVFACSTPHCQPMLLVLVVHLACMPCLCFFLVCLSIASGLYVVPSSGTPTYTQKNRHTTVCPALASGLYVLHLHLGCMSCHPHAQRSPSPGTTWTPRYRQAQSGERRGRPDWARVFRFVLAC